MEIKRCSCCNKILTKKDKFYKLCNKCQPIWKIGFKDGAEAVIQKTRATLNEINIDNFYEPISKNIFQRIL